MTRFILWGIGTAGIGGALLIVAGVILGWPVLLAFFTQTTIGRALLFVGGLIATGFAIFVRGRAAGVADQKAKEQAQTAKEVKTAAADSARIDAQTDPEPDAELSKWSPKGTKP